VNAAVNTRNEGLRLSALEAGTSANQVSPNQKNSGLKKFITFMFAQVKIGA